KKSAQSFHKFVIERGNSRRSVIYGFSNGFYRWSTFVGVPTSEVLGQTLNQSEIIPIKIRPAAGFGTRSKKTF
ncbi:hypothetical protein, partial [Leptospira borgpetersenii]